MRKGAVLIGFQNQTNLGLGYLAAMLEQRGYFVRILDFRENPEHILAAVRAENPLLVGYSLIFQSYLPQLAELAACLRDNDVTCHFCVGGHYSTLRPLETLRRVPQLDSVVSGEGELTITALMDCLAEKRDWRLIPGIVYRDGEDRVMGVHRPPISDLDTLPYPVRPPTNQSVLGKGCAPLLASRGCARSCSFCSIREFYRQVGGKPVRVRQPAKVVEEMDFLYRQHRVCYFLFQDDDFPVWGAFGRNWTKEFIQALDLQGLLGHVLWKISCRADEVDRDLFRDLRNAGLTTVYLGLESGNNVGLNTLCKGLTPEDGVRAVATLRDLDVCPSYGFMMLDPSSSFDTVRQNISFLRRITTGGIVPVQFSRMIPYAGTPIESTLAQQGRLWVSDTAPDYSFIDSRLDSFCDVLKESLFDWMSGPDSVASQFMYAWQEYYVLQRLFEVPFDLTEYRESLCDITKRSNDCLFDWLEEEVRRCEMGSDTDCSQTDIKDAAAQFLNELVETRNHFILKHQSVLLQEFANV